MNENVLAQTERVFVFIDGSNLYKGMQLHIGPGPFPPQSIDKLAQHLCGQRRLVKIMYYNSPLNRNDAAYKAQQKFFDGLRKISYLELKFGHLKKRTVKMYCATCKEMFEEANCRKCGNLLPLVKYTDKGTDVHIATDLLIHAFDNQYDTAILISEDGDFVSAIQEVTRLKKKVENAFFRKRHLAEVSDKFILLDAALINALRPAQRP